MGNDKTEFNDVAKVNASLEPSTSVLDTKSCTSTTGARKIIKAKRKLIATEKQDIDDLVRKAKISLSICSVQEKQTEAKTESELIKKVEDAVNAIFHIAGMSKVVNGTCRRALTVAAGSIMDVSDALRSRNLKEASAIKAEATKLQGVIGEFGNCIEQLESPRPSCSYSELPIATKRFTSDTSKNTEVIKTWSLSDYNTSDWVDLRVWKLMYGLTKEDVVAAIARKGEYPVELIICSDYIKYTKQGLVMGSVFVSMPAAVASIVAQGDHLNVCGFAVPIKVLPSKPIRCSMCMEAGHSRLSCKAGVDCSNMCFRCGKFGHKAVDCTASPFCTLCAEAGKPTDHAVGDRACTAPSEINYNR